MAINELFSAYLEKESAELSLQYDFHGTMKEYLSTYNTDEEVVTKLFLELMEANIELYVCKNFRFGVSQNVTNQIIHYKDIFKIAKPTFCCPFILYGKQSDSDKEYLIILVANKKDGYLIAKGMYYCLTEPNGILDGFRNDAVALYLDDNNYDEVLKSIFSFDTGTKSLGAVQRYYDRRYFKTLEELRDNCVEGSNQLFNDAKEAMLQAEDRGEIINETIARCFLFKKCMYVQMMMNKGLLVERFEGNIKKQRQTAKDYSDSIPFVSFSELWRYQKPETVEEKLEDIEVLEEILDNDEIAEQITDAIETVVEEIEALEETLDGDEETEDSDVLEEEIENES